MQVISDQGCFLTTMLQTVLYQNWKGTYLRDPKKEVSITQSNSWLGLEHNLLTFNLYKVLSGSLPLYFEHLCLPNTHSQDPHSLDSGIRTDSIQEQ